MNDIEKVFAVISFSLDNKGREIAVFAKVLEKDRVELDYVKQACFIIHKASGSNIDKGLNFIITEADEYGNRTIAQLVKELMKIGIPSLVYEYGGIYNDRILGAIMKGSEWLESADEDICYIDFDELAKECAEMA